LTAREVEMEIVPITIDGSDVVKYLVVGLGIFSSRDEAARAIWEYRH
jgi:hypothetical protein